MTMRPSAARVEYSAMPERASSTWNAISASASARTSAATFRLRQLRPAATSRAASAAKTVRNAASTTAAGGTADPCGDQHRDPARRPEHGQRRERPARDGQPAGPVRNRRQQEPRDDGPDIAEDHLVRVPVDRRKGGRKRDRAGEEWRPQRHAEHRPCARGEKERPEAAAQDRRASPCAGRSGGTAWRVIRRRQPNIPPCAPTTAAKIVTIPAASRTRWARESRMRSAAGSRAAIAEMRL